MWFQSSNAAHKVLQILPFLAYDRLQTHKVLFMSSIFQRKGDNQNPGLQDRSWHTFQCKVFREDEARNICRVPRAPPRNLFQLYIVPNIDVIASLNVGINFIGGLEQYWEKCGFPAGDPSYISIFQELL